IFGALSKISWRVGGTRQRAGILARCDRHSGHATLGNASAIEASSRRICPRACANAPGTPRRFAGGDPECESHSRSGDLNNPLRPMEASGTSGMKCAPNGGINLSVLDGWWHEGFNGNNGWAIAPEINEGTVEFQSAVDSNSLYQLLENQIIPLYYAKPDGKLPLAWLQLMRESIRSVTPVFNTHRMVKEYTERLYIPAARSHENFAQNGCEP